MAVTFTTLTSSLKIVFLLLLIGIFQLHALPFKNGEFGLNFKKYSVIRPYVIQGRVKRDVGTPGTLNENGYLHELKIGYQAFDKEFLLDLHQNHGLIPENFVVKYQKNGRTVINKSPGQESSQCYYKGKIVGNSNSWAALSTCQGLSGVVFDGSEMYFIEKNQQNNSYLHLVYRKSDFDNRKLNIGNQDDFSVKNNSIIGYNKRVPRNLNPRNKYFNYTGQRYVELVLVNDLRVFRKMDDNKDAVIERNKNIANILNALYSPLNITIALVGVDIWSEVDQIALSTDSDTSLTNFLKYRRDTLLLEIPNDNAQLITGIELDIVIAKALKGTICTHAYSGGIVVDPMEWTTNVATNIAHVLGHNLGMEHDDDNCQCPDSSCIMASTFSTQISTQWSSCSVEYLQSSFRYGMDYCLRNRPTNVVGSICGNGFVEDGEECDCGLSSGCENQCCNASFCKLTENSTCANGECCDLSTCQVKSQDVICRRAIGKCDLPEYCDGESEFCPKDVFVQDGTVCKENRTFCYNGKCNSRSDQCKLLWGETGKVSSKRCFDQNTRGNRNGNCGYDRLNQTYQPCDKTDVLCGMLHCTHLNERLEFGMESVSILSRSFITQGGKVLTCRSAIIDLGLSNVDPGLVPDGARCGLNKMCVGQKCISIDSLNTKNCDNNCNGHGICDSEGLCHCDDGFVPPICTDSNQMTN